MIVVTGASGNLGRLIIDQLVTQVDPSSIVAAARSVERLADFAERGVTVRQLDYDHPDTISSALDGATQVLLVSSSEIGRRLGQHRAVIHAAIAAKVEHLAYTSILRAETSTLALAAEHRATEEVLAHADITTTRLRHGWYIENYTENLAPALQHGVLIGSAGSGRIAAASRTDFAAADAAVLLDRSRWGGTFELAGAAFTMAELATEVSMAVGRDIPYVDMPAADLRAALVGAGLPAPMVDVLVDADLGISRGELDADSATLEALVGRPLATLRERVIAAAG